jgi:hypothetical protein
LNAVKRSLLNLIDYGPVQQHLLQVQNRGQSSKVTSVSSLFLLWPRGNSPVMESSLDSGLLFREVLNSSSELLLLLLLELSPDKMSSTSCGKILFGEIPKNLRLEVFSNCL